MAFTSTNGRTQTALADINVTPLVDVVLVLLIIFMVTAPVLQSGIEVNVPHTRTVKEITEERLVISIDKSQKVFLGNDPINIKWRPSLIPISIPNTASCAGLWPGRLDCIWRSRLSCCFIRCLLAAFGGRTGAAAEVGMPWERRW